MKTVAIGDVHGCYTLLKETIKPLIGTQSEVVFLGDLIDRSPEPEGDLKVLRYVHNLQTNPQDYGLSKVTVVSGNHEQLFLKAVQEGPNNPFYDIWEFNGGNPELCFKANKFVNWIENLPKYYIKNNILFVHAGVRPGIPLDQQNEQDFLWIREPFLSTPDHGLPYLVVHGHTIVPQLQITPYRISIDTGAYFTGNLTAIEIYNPS